MVEMRLMESLVTVYKADQRNEILTVGKLAINHYNYEGRTNE